VFRPSVPAKPAPVLLRNSLGNISQSESDDDDEF